LVYLLPYLIKMFFHLVFPFYSPPQEN
jgi:hypothetical protein